MKGFLALVGSLILLPTAPLSQPCEIPASYLNQVVVDEGTLRIHYASDKVSYGPTEVVSLYLVVENIGQETFYLNWGVDPQDGHFILRPPYESFADCCSTEEERWANTLAYHPETIYFFSIGTTLLPGECRTWQRSLNLAHTENPAPGTYAVLGGMFQAFDGPFVAPSGGATLHITLQAPLSTRVSTWGGVKALYR
jgi:hypothetical protein